MKCNGYGCSCPAYLKGSTDKQGWTHCNACGHTEQTHQKKESK